MNILVKNWANKNDLGNFFFDIENHVAGKTWRGRKSCIASNLNQFALTESIYRVFISQVLFTFDQAPKSM